MDKNLLIAGILSGSLLAGVSVAGDFDGSKPLLCAIQMVHECVDGGQCNAVLPRQVNLPNFLTVNVAENMLTGTREGGLDAQTPVERVERLDGKLMLQGADDGLPDARDGMVWSLSIDEESGRAAITASGDDFALVAFGSCLVK